MGGGPECSSTRLMSTPCEKVTGTNDWQRGQLTYLPAMLSGTRMGFLQAGQSN